MVISKRCECGELDRVECMCHTFDEITFEEIKEYQRELERLLDLEDDLEYDDDEDEEDDGLNKGESPLDCG